MKDVHVRGGIRACALLVLALLLATPPTLAHAGDLTGVFGVEAEGLGVFLQADTLVVKAQREIVFNGTVASNASGEIERVENASVAIEASGPGQATFHVTPREGGFQARVTFPAPGEWHALATVDGKLRRIPIHVYPATTVWMEASNLRTNYHYVDRAVSANLFFLDDATGMVVEAKEPATGRLSRLVNDSPVDTQQVTLAPGPMGSVVFAHTFQEEGNYVLSVASAPHAIGFDSLPEIPFLIRPPLGGAASTPGLAVVALLALVAALALARKK